MWRGNASWSIIAFRLLLDNCFLAALKPLLSGYLSRFIWSCSATLLVTISNCSLQLWGKGAWGEIKHGKRQGWEGSAQEGLLQQGLC